MTTTEQMLREALQDLIRAYVRALENGRDRIVMLGGQCDPVDVMERDDPSLRQAKAALAQPAEGGEADTGPQVLRQVFALCEATEEALHESCSQHSREDSTQFNRGRLFEAKGIRKAIGTWFQDEFCGRSLMGEPVTTPPASPEQAAWCEYVAGMVDHWVRSDEYTSVKADEDCCTKAIAGIIERRLSALKREPAKPEQDGACVRNTAFGKQAEKLADDFLALNSLYVAALERITELESRHSQAQQPKCSNCNCLTQCGDVDAFSAEQAQQPSGDVVLPDGWVPLTIEYEPGYPEDVAYGPRRMMDRLKKWLDRHFATLAALKPEPMTEEQKRAAWVACSIDLPSPENCYLRGIVDGEAHHGITSTKGDI